MSDLVRDAKLNRPGPGLAVLAQLGIQGLDNSQETDLSFGTLLKRLMLGSGVNHIIQVNDCETAADFTESDSGTFDIAASAATGKRVGTNCTKLVATAACDGTQYVQTLLINESAVCPKDPVGGTGFRQQNWSDTAYIGFWNHTENSGDFGTAGEMTIALVYNGGQVSTQQSVPATVATVHQWAEFKLSGFLVAAGGAAIPLDKIEGLRFYCANANVGEYVQYDDIIRYLISVDGAPFYGAGFPIKSGTTLVQGNSAKWTVDGLITGAADAPTLGPVVLPDGDSVTGDGARSKWGQFAAPIRIGLIRANAATTAGDQLQWVSGTSKALVTDVTTTATEKGYAIALEAAGAQYDDVFAVFVKEGKSA